MQPVPSCVRQHLALICEELCGLAFGALRAGGGLVLVALAVPSAVAGAVAVQDGDPSTAAAAAAILAIGFLAQWERPLLLLVGLLLQLALVGAMLSVPEPPHFFAALCALLLAPLLLAWYLQLALWSRDLWMKRRTRCRLDSAFDSFLEDCVRVGRELTEAGVISQDEVEEMSCELIMRIPAVAVLDSLVDESRPDRQSSSRCSEGMTALSHIGVSEPSLQPVSRSLTIAGTRLRELQLSQQEWIEVRQTLAGAGHFGIASPEQRADELRKLVATMNGLALDISRLQPFKARAQQLFLDIGAAR